MTDFDFESHAGIRLDIGGGSNPQPGFVNMDVRDLPEVDIVHDVTKFPWPLPDESVLVAIASHLVEHIPPFAPDPRLAGLIRLLADKGVVSHEDITEYCGEVGGTPTFVRFMDEAWRVLKPGGEFAIAAPHGNSQGFLQDPTHINGLNEATWSYFTPGHPLYDIYRPKPWIIKHLSWSPNANIEVVLVKITKEEVGNDPS